MIVLFGGAAGSGKTTVARLWCLSRLRSVHIQLDDIRSLIISGLANPQVQTLEQSAQYVHSVAACTALARSFNSDGYDVALDDVFEPEPTRELWLPRLSGLDIRLIVLHPPIDIALSRMTGRKKQVLEHIIRSQHSAMNNWPLSYRIDSGSLTSTQTLKCVDNILESAAISNL